MLLVGDIGGTKADLAILSVERGARAPIASARLPVAAYDSLESLARSFVDRAGISVDRACFGIAGPVVDGRAVGTNLPWVVDEGRIGRRLGLRSVKLLNDLEAIANGIPLLQGEDIYTLSNGTRVEHGALAVIAPGTGLGEGYMLWDGQRYRAYPSEGGHADFAPNTVLECELWRYLHERHGHVSYERVCSGVGIPNIYAFLKGSGRADEPGWLAERLGETSDPTPVIVTTGLGKEPDCEICRLTLETFISILGAAAGNLALRLMATGGVYLGGGIPPRILDALDKPPFLKAFCSKGRLSPVVERVPVHVVLNPRVGLLGAASYGLAL